jgi:DNA polymerase
MNARRDSTLREMGLGPLWRLRARSDVAAVEGPVVASAPAPAKLAEAAQESAPRAQASGSTAQAVSVERAAVQAAMGASADGRGERISRLDWDALEADIRACTACRLCERRKQAVPGVGDRRADWMLVGEGPGAEEDQRGEPFVGAAGRLLDAMLAAIGLKRGEGVYIANAVKCRPPHNRTPESDEIATCFPYLARQIELVRPRLIVALGRPAAQALLKAEVSIGASRGRLFQYAGTPLVVTYHPAYLLRNPADKAKAWEDLCFARRVIRESSGL